MNQNIVYVGIDVDDVRYHGCALNPRTGEVLDISLSSDIEGPGRTTREGAGSISARCS